MKIKHILSILVLNFALVGFVSIFQEYNDVDGKIESLNYTASTAVDSAVQLTMTSEELFGDKNSWKDKSKISSKDDKYARLTYYDGSEWKTNDLFAVAKEFSNRSSSNAVDRFPSTDVHMKSDDIYNWLYKDSSFFNKYYNSIGKNLSTSLYTKSGESADYKSDGFTLDKDKVPVLDQMGIFTNTSLHNNSDSFTSAEKDGKEKLTGSYELPTTDGTEKNTDDQSKYYVTPTSLGVTYLDPRVLKASVIAHLENVMRYTKGGDDNSSNTSLGTIPTDVHVNGGVYAPQVSSDEAIFNNGTVEIDMSSVNVDVNYALVNAYDSANDDLMGYVEGTEDRGKSSVLKSEDTANSESKDADRNKRIVAKVTVTFNAHLPYSTPVMQWVRYMSRSDDKDHLDIRSIGNDGNVDNSKNGIEYKYTTYVSVSR